MKNIYAIVLGLLWASPTLAQVPLGSTYTPKFVMTFSSTGTEVAADSTPTCDVYEETTSTPIIVDGSMSLMASTTNVYYIQIAATTGNGFEDGKWYNQVCKATVGGLLQNIPNDHFQIRAERLFQKGVAFPNFGVFMHRQGQAGNVGYTGGTISCQSSTSNGAGFSAFSGTGISASTEIANGTYSVDLDSTVIGNATWIRCTGSGGTGAADVFLQEIFGQR